MPLFWKTVNYWNRFFDDLSDEIMMMKSANVLSFPQQLIPLTFCCWNKPFTFNNCMEISLIVIHNDPISKGWNSSFWHFYGIDKFGHHYFPSNLLWHILIVINSGSSWFRLPKESFHSSRVTYFAIMIADKDFWHAFFYRIQNDEQNWRENVF